MTISSPTFKPGQRVRITQQISRQSKIGTLAVEGVVEVFEQQKTGSWYAHSEDKKLWLDRLLVRKDDGELAWFNLDRWSRVEVIG